MQCVNIESPYAGDRARNAEYLRRAMQDSLGRGEAPFAMHALYPQYLDDAIGEERRLGIATGTAWALHANTWAFYADYGFSPGMREALRYLVENKIVGKLLEIRLIGQNPCE